jgi:hypothetical protein
MSQQMAELGRIEKPEVARYAGRRKLYCIRSVYLPVNAPEDLLRLLERYWDETAEQVEKLEAAGRAGKIFCEGITDQKESLNRLKDANPRLFAIIEKKRTGGGELIPLEDGEIFGQFLDWSSCLTVVRTSEVFEKVFEFYNELRDRRYRHIIDTVDSCLSEGEAGLLVMRDEDRENIRFPEDIEMFLITPPSYDDLMKWMKA